MVRYKGINRIKGGYCLTFAKRSQAYYVHIKKAGMFTEAMFYKKSHKAKRELIYMFRCFIPRGVDIINHVKVQLRVVTSIACG